MTNTGAPSPDQMSRRFAMAVERFETGDLAGAETLLQEILTHAPGHPQVLYSLAMVANRRNDHARARALLTDTVKAMPDFADAWDNLGYLAMQQNDPAAAVSAFQQVCRLSPKSPDAVINLAHALHATELFNEAINFYRKGLAGKPDHPSAWGSLSRALLMEGRWGEAAEAADRQLAVEPGHTVALALKSVALQEQGDEAGLQSLVDFDRLIEGFDIEVPDGYADLADFNRALADFCTSHRSLKYAPEDKATEFGLQSNNLAGEADSPVADLLKAVEKCVQKYREKRPVSSDHPFLSQRPDSWQTDMWATVLESGGHQQSHIHRIGWLSGVYYVQKPDVVDTESPDGDKTGWIEFGRPVFYPKAEAEPSTRYYPPVEGRLYLFPSYFYHRTIPFISETPRISIAMDLRDRPITHQVPFIDYING